MRVSPNLDRPPTDVGAGKGPQFLALLQSDRSKLYPLSANDRSGQQGLGRQLSSRKGPVSNFYDCWKKGN